MQNHLFKQAGKRFISILLAAVMVLGLFPAEPFTVFAADEVCEIVREGVVVDSCMTLGKAVEVLPNGNLAKLQRGDTIRLLADINHTTGIFFGRTYNSRLGELTIDLNGHKLNLSNTDDCALYLKNTEINVIHDKPGSDFNVSMTSTVSDTVYAIEMAGDDYYDEYSGVSYVNNVTASGHNVMAIRGDVSEINVAGNVTATGVHDYSGCVEVDRSTFNIAGDVILNVPAENSGSSDSFNAVSVGISSEVYVGGSVLASNGYGVSVNGSKYVDTGTVVTVKGDVKSAGGVNCSDALVEVFGDVISSTNYSWAGSVSANSEGRAIVHGNVELYTDGNYSSAVTSYSGAEITVLGNVISQETAVANDGGPSSIFIAGDVTSLESHAIRAGDMKTYDDSDGYFDEKHVIHIGGDVTAPKPLDNWDYLDRCYGVSCTPGARVIIDGKITAWREIGHEFDSVNEPPQAKVEVVSEPARPQYITHKVTFIWDEENNPAYVWLRDPTAQPTAFISNPLLTNGTSATKSYADDGDTMNLTMYGTAGGNATAVVTYINGEPPVEATRTITLTEEKVANKGTSIYKGSFTIEDMSAIKSIAYTLDVAGEKATASIPASKLPEIRGSLKVDIVNTYLNDFPGAKIAGLLTASSSSGGNSMNISITDNESVMIKGLAANADYKLEMHSAGNDLLGSLDGIDVKAGKTSEVSLTPSLYANLSVKLADDTDGAWMRVMLVTVRDVATGNILCTLPANGLANTSTQKFPVNSVLELTYPGGVKQVSVNGKNETRCYKDIKQQITIVPVTNDVVIRHQVLQKDATLQGTVTLDGVKVKNASVSVSQQAMDSNINFTATTDENGFYSLPVYPGFPTTAVITHTPGGAASFESKYKPPVTPVSGSATPLDFELVKAMIINSNLRLFTQYIGEPGLTEQLLERIQGVHLNMLFTNQRTGQTVEWGGLKYMSVVEGDKIIVEIDGRRGGLPSAMHEVTVDATGTISQDITLIQEGALIDIQLVDSSGADISRNSASKPWVRVTDTATYRTPRYRLSEIGANHYQLWVDKAGTYKVEFGVDKSITDPDTGKQSNHNYRGTFSITVSNGQVVSFGNLVLAEQDYGWISGQCVAMPAVSSPGGTVTLMASYSVEYASDPTDTTLTLQIPSGTSFQTGSLTLNNKILNNPTADSNGFFTVQVPASEASSGSASFRVSLNGDINAINTFSTATYGTYFLGTADIQVETLTLEAPDYVYKRDVSLKGYAPAGSAVTLYDRGAPIGTATATEAGNWSAKVILPGEDGVKRLYEFHAETVINGKTLATDTAHTIYDPKRPQLAKLIVNNPDGSQRQFDASSLPAAFPYTFYPSVFYLDVAAQFTNNAAVENVIFTIESAGFVSTAEGTYNAARGVYEARLENAMEGACAGASTGNIYVAYDTITTPDTVDLTPVDALGMLNRLPGEFGDIIIESASEPTIGADESISMSVEFRLKPGGDIVKCSISLAQVDLDNYTLTQADIDSYNETGIPMYDYQFNEIMDGEEAVGFRNSVIIPEAFLETLGYISPFSQMPSGRSALRTPTAVGILVKTAWDSASNAYSASGFVTGKNKIAAMEAMAKNCPSDLLRNNAYKAGETNKYNKRSQAVYFVIGLVLLPISGFAAAAIGVAIFAMSIYEDQKANADIDKRYGQSKDHYMRNCHGRLGNPDAIPWFIYDPSGVVYEAVTKEPLEGVTATALVLKNDVWTVWDAGWYEQENPLVTASDGWYAWDVPNGLWKVMYEKEGYRTEFSEEMAVPPIRTDVNIPMESIEPAAVEGAYSLEGAIEIVFDKHVKVSDINANNVSVHAAAAATDGTALGVNNFLQGTFVAIDPVNYEDELVAKSFQFVPGETMAQSDYYVGFTPAIHSYAGVPLGFAEDGTNYAVAVSEAPAPVAVTGVELDKKQYALKAGGQPVRALATVKPQNATDKRVTWKTSNAGIATVDQNGLITPAGVGNCVLTVTTNDGGFEATAGVSVSGSGTVGEVPVTGVTLDKSKLNLTLGGSSAKLNATVQPANATNQSVSWSVCNTNIITVDQNGTVTPVGAGTCVVTVTTQEGGFWAECVVEVTASSVATYTVTFNPNGGTRTGGGDLIQTVTDGGAATAPIVTRSGYNFSGWNKPFNNVTANMTVTALWTPIGGSNPGSNSTPDPVKTITVHGIAIAVTIDKDGIATIKLTEDQVKKIIEACEYGNLLFDFGTQNGVTGLIFDFNPAWFNVAKVNSLTLKLKDIGSVTVKVGMIGKLTKLNKMLQFTIKKGSLVFDILEDGRSIGWYDYENPILVILPVTDKNVVMKNTPRSWVKDWTLYGYVYSTGRYEVVSADPISFMDTQGKWMDTAAQYMSARGIIAGIGNNLFAPERNVTRAEFVTMLMRALNIEPQGDWRSATQQFSDIPEGAYYYEALLKAKAFGIVNGVGDNKYNPNATVSRQDMLTMLYNAMVKCGLITPVTDAEEPKWFDNCKDSGEISGYARKAMSTFIKEGIVSGKGNGILDPKGMATRAEAAQIIYNMLLLDSK